MRSFPIRALVATALRALVLPAYACQGERPISVDDSSTPAASVAERSVEYKFWARAPRSERKNGYVESRYWPANPPAVLEAFYDGPPSRVDAVLARSSCAHSNPIIIFPLHPDIYGGNSLTADVAGDPRKLVDRGFAVIFWTKKTQDVVACADLNAKNQ